MIQEKALASQNYPRILTLLALIAAILLWASAFPAISIALTAYTPTEVAFLRYAIASIILTGYAVVQRMSLPTRKDLPSIALCGFMGFTVYNVMLNAGQVTVSAGVASFIISAEIGVIALLARLFFRERHH